MDALTFITTKNFLNNYLWNKNDSRIQGDIKLKIFWCCIHFEGKPVRQQFYIHMIDYKIINVV